MKKVTLLLAFLLVLSACSFNPMERGEVSSKQFMGPGMGDTFIPVESKEQAFPFPESKSMVMGDILMITFDAGYLPGSLNVYNALDSLGYNVVHLYNPPTGLITTTLDSQIFQQVWLFDIEVALKISVDDAKAIADWYHQFAHGNIIIDARSYGAYYDIANDMPFIENEAYAFMKRCGGLWIGTDHADMWAYNGNEVLKEIGYNLVTGMLNPFAVVGDYGNPVGTELLTVPNVIVPANLNAFASPGIAPMGLQFDGVFLDRVLVADSLNGDTLTSASLAKNYCDLIPPEILIDLAFDVLWPPNHKMIHVGEVLVTDNMDPNPLVTIEVTSNQPINGNGDGNTEPDFLIEGNQLYLRAERSGLEEGRIYTIKVTATDMCGNMATAEATVLVPHDKR